MTALGGGVAVEDPIVVSTDNECSVFLLGLVLREIISEVGASQMSDFGKVMPQVMKKGAGKVDGNVAQSIVKELLS